MRLNSNLVCLAVLVGACLTANLSAADLVWEEWPTATGKDLNEAIEAKPDVFAAEFIAAPLDKRTTFLSQLPRMTDVALERRARGLSAALHEADERWRRARRTVLSKRQEAQLRMARCVEVLTQLIAAYRETPALLNEEGVSGLYCLGLSLAQDEIRTQAREIALRNSCVEGAREEFTGVSKGLRRVSFDFRLRPEERAFALILRQGSAESTVRVLELIECRLREADATKSKSTAMSGEHAELLVELYHRKDLPQARSDVMRLLSEGRAYQQLDALLPEYAEYAKKDKETASILKALQEDQAERKKTPAK